MRIYDGSPRQNYEEVLRSIGAFLDQRGMKEVLLVEAPDGFVVQGLVVENAASGAWSEHLGQQAKETFTFLDDDIARFMEEGHARRDNQQHAVTWGQAGYYEQAFRVVGQVCRRAEAARHLLLRAGRRVRPAASDGDADRQPARHRGIHARRGRGDDRRRPRT